MPISIRTDTRGFERKIKQFERLARGNTRMWHEIGNVILKSVDKNFDVGGRPAWAALKPATIKRKQAAGRTKKLIWSGKMRKNIKKVVSRNDVVVYSNVPYGPVHQFGGGNNIPPRPYIKVLPEDRKQIARIIDSYIERAGR